MSHTFVRPALALYTLTLATVLAFPVIAAACPFCGGPAAEAVRREVFGPAFWSHVAAATSPFVVMLAVAGVVYGRPARRPGGGR